MGCAQQQARLQVYDTGAGLKSLALSIKRWQRHADGWHLSGYAPVQARFASIARQALGADAMVLLSSIGVIWVFCDGIYLAFKGKDYYRGNSNG